MILKITSENFSSEVLEAKDDILVDFWAEWCGPCRMLAPVLEEISREHEDIAIGKLNIDENPELAQKYGVMSIPTLILFSGGQPVQKIVGLRPKEDILSFIQNKA